MSKSDAPTDSIQDLAHSCVDFVQRSLGLPLDYTQDTLPILDHYLRTARAEATRSAMLAPLAAASGAYFGQLVIRQFPGASCHSDVDLQRWRVQFSTVFLHFNPIGIAQEVLTQDDAPGWSAHFSTLEDQRQVIEQSIDSQLQLRAEDYYSFSVRYEMLDQVVAVLSALEEQRREGRRTFGDDVYTALTGGSVQAKS